MSYNIDNITVLSFDKARISKDDVERFAESDELPESSFFEELKRADKDGYCAIDPRRFWWSGEGSGRIWKEVFIDKIAPKIMGKIEAVVFWEGGDSVSGLRIVDGKVTEPEVVMTLAPDKQ
jgi:hypothetical protein